jgi:hypothetical protein
LRLAAFPAGLEDLTFFFAIVDFTVFVFPFAGVADFLALLPPLKMVSQFSAYLRFDPIETVLTVACPPQT